MRPGASAVQRDYQESHTTLTDILRCRLDKWIDQLWHLLISPVGLARVLSFLGTRKSIQDNPRAKHEQSHQRWTRPTWTPLLPANSHFTTLSAYTSASPTKSSKLPHTVNFVLKCENSSLISSFGFFICLYDPRFDGSIVSNIHPSAIFEDRS